MEAMPRPRVAGRRARAFRPTLAVALGALALCLAGLARPRAETDESTASANTLEDVYDVPSAESFQTATGFRVLEGNTTNGAAQTSFGTSLDDQVVNWREYRTVADGTTCSTSTSVCATVEVESGQLYEGNGVLTITVTDPFPYRCTGGPTCTPEGRNDCNHDGDFVDGADDNDCDDNGVTDVLARAFQSSTTPDSEWVILDRVGSTTAYRGTLPVAIGGNVSGVLFLVDLESSIGDDFTIRYPDLWDGSANGSDCGNDPNPAKQGNVDAGLDLVLGDRGDVVVTCFRVDDTIAQPVGAASDGDGYPDTNETADLYVTLSNKNFFDVTNLVVQASANDPKIECLLLTVQTVSSLASRGSVEVGPFRFKVNGLADRGGTVPAVSCASSVCSNGAGACTISTECRKTRDDVFAATFTLAMSADQFDLNQTPQQIALDLDLDSSNPVVTTSTFTEGFEAGLGNFQLMNMDVNIASNSASNGMRCQYNDPDFVNSNSYGDTECYLGFIAGQTPNNEWHVHGTMAPDGGRSYLGVQSLHYGHHITGNPGQDTTMLSQMDAIRTKANVNLAARVCAALQSGFVQSCNSAADCTSPASPCVSASPELSFKHQVSTADNRHTNTPDGHTVDRFVVHAQIAGTSTIWQKLYPFTNVYDAQGTDFFSNCMFDPVDDGNNEDSFFDPTDPARRLGPSSTCFPEFSFSYLGDTDEPFAPANIGRASDGPGLAGATGLGTWVESKFCMARFRGRQIRLRYLFTSIKVSDTQTMSMLFMWNPIPDDDGMYIDDIRLTQTLGTAAPTVTSDTKANGNVACDTWCAMTGPTLTASPPSSTAPGRLVTLTAVATVTQCANGLVLYQFWNDANGNGVIDTGIDILLRDFSPNPVLEEAPVTGPAMYLVRAKCSTVVACSGAAAATVTVNTPGVATIFPYVPLKIQCVSGASCAASDKSVLTWGFADPSGVEVIRGNLTALRNPLNPGGAGNFNNTVLGCVADDVTSASTTDATIPGTLQQFYYLARRSVVNQTWTSFSLREVAGRDIEMDGPPKAANSCTSPP